MAVGCWLMVGFFIEFVVVARIFILAGVGALPTKPGVLGLGSGFNPETSIRLGRSRSSEPARWTEMLVSLLMPDRQRIPSD